MAEEPGTPGLPGTPGVPAPVLGGEPAPNPGIPGTPPNPGNPGTPPAPAAFDWKTQTGIDEVGQAVIKQRGWTDPASLLTSYTNLEKLSGVPPEQIVKIPKGNDPGEWAEAYTKLGRPAEASGYQLPVPEGDNGEFAKTASAWFHEAGLSQHAASKVAEQWNAHNEATAKTEADNYAADVAQSMNELETAWGNDYQANTAVVEKAAQEFGMTNDQLNGLKSQLGVKGAMEFMYNIGSKIASEDTELVRGLDGSLPFSGMTAAQAQGEIARLKKDTNFVAQFASSDPKVRQEAGEKKRRLHQIAYPQGA